MKDYMNEFSLSRKVLFSRVIVDNCSGNAKSRLEVVIEHLAGRQGQHIGAQVCAVQYT